MEFPDLGEHCTDLTCNQLDFLPMKCDACSKIFCKDHFPYGQHNCEKAYQKDVQVPVCPLCNKPVSVKRGEPPDITVGEHIDRDCLSDPAAKRKIYTNRCSLKGCKQKELIPVICSQCKQNFCLKHRHPADHKCEGFQRTSHIISPTEAAGVARTQNKLTSTNALSAWTSPTTSSGLYTPVPSRSKTNETLVTAIHIQGNLNEDEALALALQNSLSNSLETSPSQTPPNISRSPVSQEEADRQLALALTESERNHQEGQRHRRSSSYLCNIT
ncbi:AN1-type zinc finger protein 2A-like isoform X2 [Limulus polyphemus]|uniref:AN1-type zinc finger protein 2A-like isoform X2 n=1 Tax=Limulus polyphemus TaxID=6850 RepID=A0ABM1B825_LIMPO|nr:AN1-type zinc finger protein 2A-like isoform X2 [Limulus polyphemus]